MIVDEAGKIALCTPVFAQNRINVGRVISPDPDDGLRTVVGSTWLPQLKQVGTSPR